MFDLPVQCAKGYAKHFHSIKLTQLAYLIYSTKLPKRIAYGPVKGMRCLDKEKQESSGTVRPQVWHMYLFSGHFSFRIRHVQVVVTAASDQLKGRKSYHTLVSTSPVGLYLLSTDESMLGLVLER